jgi:hypothetical protein
MKYISWFGQVKIETGLLDGSSRKYYHLEEKLPYEFE